MHATLFYSQPRTNISGTAPIWERKQHTLEAPNHNELVSLQRAFLAEGAVTIAGTTYHRSPIELKEFEPPREAAKLLPEFDLPLDYELGS